MASYHWSMQIIGRKDGRSAIRAAAYRAGQDLRDERTGEVHRFGQRRGVDHSEILLPPLTHVKLANRQTLWNTVERAEVREDAQLAREVNIALPHELSRDQRLALVRGYVREEFVRRGMIADIAMHIPRPGRGEDERNVHAHVMLTLRQGSPQGLYAVKTREWNSRELLKHWRLAWAEHANRALAEAGFQTRIDARSLAEQRDLALAEGDEARARSLTREPELHMGPNAVEMARKAARERAREQKHDQAQRQALPLPDKVAENAERLNRNANRAWHRHADAKVAEARWARQLLLGPELVTFRKDGSVLSYADLVERHDRPAPKGQVGKIIGRMRDTEITEQAIKVWRSTGHNLGMADDALLHLLVSAQMRPMARSPFQVTAKDIAFAFYRMGLLSLDRLSTTLELIEAEVALQHASARKESFWSRVLPRHRGQMVRQVRGRHRSCASDPKDP